MDASGSRYDTVKAALFARELNSIWKEVDLSRYSPTSPRETPVRAKQDGTISTKTCMEVDLVTGRGVSKGTQLLSMDQFLPDSAPSSSYGCGEGRSGTNSAEKSKHSYGDVLHLPYSCNSVGLNHNIDYVYN